MSVTININQLTLCHKGSDGVSAATLPDVCFTPSAAGLPLPYPNIAFSSDVAKGTTTITADGGNMCANFGSEFSKSTGDEPGSGGGILSGTFIKEATWLSFSFDVKLEGQGACRLTDKMFHNHWNTVNAAGLVQIFIAGDKAWNLACTVLCRVLKMREKFLKENPGKRFNFSKEAEKLAEKEYGAEMAEIGLRAEERTLVRVAEKGLAESVEQAGRALLTNEEVAAKLARAAIDAGKAGAEVGAEVVVGAELGAEVGGVATIETGPGVVAGAGAGGGIGGIIGGAIGVVNVVLDAYLIKDLAELGGAAINAVTTAWKGSQVVQIIPDLALTGKNGEILEILDYKGPGDRLRDVQGDLAKAASGKEPRVVSLKNCKNCEP